MKNWWKIGCITATSLLVSCIIISAAVAIYTKMLRQPLTSAAESLHQALSLQVELITPNESEQWPVNAFVPVRAVAKSDDRIAAVELWVDGKFFAAREDLKERDVNIATGEWYWQPATQGTHTLMVRGADTHGLTGFSKIIRINAVEAVGSRQLVTPTQGQTMTQIADANGVGIDILKDNNPGLDPNQPLTPQEDVFIPKAPAPVKDVETSTQAPYSPPQETGSGISNWKVNLPFIGQLIPDNSSRTGTLLPAAPTLLNANLQNGCDAYLEFKDNANNEDGNRIYRAMPGQSTFSKIADLPPYITKTIIHNDQKLNIKGGWMYYASSYNAAGESKSLPVKIDVSDPGCFPPETVPGSTVGKILKLGTFTDDFLIISPEPVDMAYVYITINGVSHRNPPESYQFFQKGSGYTFDLSQYLLESVANLPDATEYKIQVQLWGWKGGKPTLIEEYEKIITDYTRLLACQETTLGGCDAPNAVWSDKIFTWDDPKNLKLRFKLVTLKKSSSLTWGFYDGASTSVSDDNMYKKDILDYPATPGGAPVFFNDSFAPLFDQTDQNINVKYDWQKDKLPWIRPGFWRNHKSDKNFTAFYQAWPRYDGGAANTTEFHQESNRVYVFNWPTNSQISPAQTAYAPVWPDIYKVEFLKDSYVAPKFPIPQNYGCIQYLEAGNGHPAGFVDCPKPYVNPCKTDISWKCFKSTGLAALNEFIDAYDWIAAKYGEVVSFFSKGLIKIIPGCEGTSACEYIAKKTSEVAWTFVTTSLGLPPELPQSNQLANAGIKSAISGYVGSAYETAVNDSGLMDKIEKSGALDVIPDSVKNYFSNKASEFKDFLANEIYDQFYNALRTKKADACQDVDTGHANGYEPLCPPPNVAWKPAPGAQFVGPFIDVKITRKELADNTNYGTDSTSVNYLDVGMYALKVTNTTVNESRVGQALPFWMGYNENFTPDSCNNFGCDPVFQEPPVCYFGAGSIIPLPCYIKVEKPLQSSLYKDLELPIPWLEPGKNVVMPLYFSQNSFWYQNRDQKISQITDPVTWKNNYGDDWNYLYFKGKQSFKVEEACRTNIPENIFCGSSDEFSPSVPEP